MKKKEKICIAISAIIILWLFVSFIEVNAKNLEPNPQYNDWNAFVLLTEGANGKIKGYYTNNVYMGFIPSVGKYWQFESETAYRNYMKERGEI